MKLLKYWFLFFCIFAIATSLVKANRFDGVYTGIYTGTAYANNGATRPDNGSTSFIVSNGVIVVTDPGSGLGSVNAAGSTSFSGSGSDGVSYTFGGTFVISPSGVAIAGGTWQASAPEGTANGQWSATNDLNITLGIQTAANQTALLYWPTNSGNFVLQQNLSLGTPNWVQNTNPVNLVNGTNKVTLNLSTNSFFFRLIQQ